MIANGHAAHFDDEGVRIIEKDTHIIAATATVFEDMYLIKAKAFRTKLIGTHGENNNTFLNPYEGNVKMEVGRYVIEAGKQNIHGTVETWH